MARAVLTVDLDAIIGNWLALDALSAPGVETAAVLKADAYGLGLRHVAPALRHAGVQNFFVALAEEGAELRDTLGPRPKIHVFGGLMPGDADLCQENALMPCLNSAEQVREFHALGRRGPCSLQVDSGMNRLGMERGEIAAVADAIVELKPALVMSHLACATDPAHVQNGAQAREFAALLPLLPAARRSLAATGGILLGAPYHHDLTRPGIGLYGGLPFADAEPVVTLSLPVIQVREVAAGECVGYGADWRAPRTARIATVSAGYGDGLPRALGGKGVSLMAGAIPCPLVGRVSMDLLTVDVSHLPEVPDRLEILNANQTIDDLADAAGTIGYEILTSLGGRYHRVYKGAAKFPDPE